MLELALYLGEHDRSYPVGLFQKYHNTLYFSSKIFHKHCFYSLLGLTMIPRETRSNAYADGGTNKDYYGIFESGPLLLTGRFYGHQANAMTKVAETAQHI